MLNININMIDTIYIFFFAAIGIIIAIGIGIELSKGIDEFVIYVLFWMLYIVSIVTFVNIVLVGNYYITMKDKQGIPGPPGETGNTGDKGSAGLCDPKCRDSICENQINNLITTKLTKRNNGAVIKLNNVYIKSKVRQQCASDEFKQLAPYNGPQNLINYMIDIWGLWIDILYDAGGSKYFENVAAESEFEWIAQNPFDELKKYDVFYWGMGRQYRPQVREKCYLSANGNTPNADDNQSILHTSKTNLYDFLGNDDGSGSQYTVSFWRAKQFTYKGNVYYPVGDIAIGPTRTNEKINIVRHIGAIQLATEIEGPNRETIIVSGDVEGPINYERIWTNYDRRKTKYFWLWRPIAPQGYIALGDVVTFTSNPPPTGNNAPIRCVLKSFTIRQSPNGNILWSSHGMTQSADATILGFKPNDGSYISSSDSNCYNMFRAVGGLNSTSIPETDINANFYILNSTKYDSNFQIAADLGDPSTENIANNVGKGYMPSPVKDAKYSVLSYLNLKNTAKLTHPPTNKILNAELVPNAISNAYLIKLDIGVTTKCLNYEENTVTIGNCDELKQSQIFSIIFTGNKKNECRIQHYDSKQILDFKDNIFRLVDYNKTDVSNTDANKFIMQ